jgi:hypothetical protein
VKATRKIFKIWISIGAKWDCSILKNIKVLALKLFRIISNKINFFKKVSKFLDRKIGKLTILNHQPHKFPL